MKKFKNHEKKWERMARLWKEFSKPGRPSKGDIKNFFLLAEAILAGKKSPKILVLGSTPEVRDMLFYFREKLKAKIVCADMTKDMYLAMRGFVKKKNKNEVFIETNWLKISDKIKNSSIDLVIGDFVIGNVGGFEKELLNEISKILKKNGYFITRAQIIDGIKLRKNLYLELKRQAKAVERKKINIKEASSYFANNVICSGWHLNKENKTSLAFFPEKSYSNLDVRVKKNKNKIEQKVLNQFYKSWWLMKDKYWIVYRKNKLEAIIKHYFNIKKELHSNDYEIAKISPIYLLKNDKQ